ELGFQFRVEFVEFKDNSGLEPVGDCLVGINKRRLHRLLHLLIETLIYEKGDAGCLVFVIVVAALIILGFGLTLIIDALDQILIGTPHYIFSDRLGFALGLAVAVGMLNPK